MNLLNYLNKKVQIIISNGFTYLGVCIDADSDSLTLIDKTNSQISIREQNILSIKEIPK